ncbi:MAG: class II aldolase/adducin family protein [Deferrisomatales bacterium]|nr:class II aldolase/adducin family protein [Deferrisomatales bacterium]
MSSTKGCGAVGAEELRVQVAACTRLLHLQGILGYSGHVSARLGGGDSFLIQSFDDSRAELLPERLLVADLDGKPFSSTSSGKLPNEVTIHAEIYRHRPDVAAVVHMHPELATVFTLVEGVRLQPMKMHAARWADGIPVHPEPGHIKSQEQGRALARTLGDCHAVLLRAHGAVLVAESIPALLVDSVHFEENAKAQHLAAALGTVVPLSDAELALLQANSNRAQHVAKLWSYYLRLGLGAGVLPTDWESRLG